MTLSREDPKFWDVRTLERRMRKGIVTKKDLEKHLKTIDDSKTKVAPPSNPDDDGGEA